MSIEQFNHKVYLYRLLKRENILLAHADIPFSQPGYFVSRDVIAEFAYPYIYGLIEARCKPKILEIGGGKGKAIKKIIADNPNLDPSTITMTSLTPLDDHKELKTRGVHAYTGVLAEQLPKQWEEQFDLVMTSALLQWTRIPMVLAEIKRVLKPGGIWLNLEQYDNFTTCFNIKTTMDRLAMKDSTSNIDKAYYYNFYSMLPFIFIK